MVSGKSKIVFEALMPHLKSGEYVVITRKELETMLPETISKADYETAINSFQVNGYMSLRYSDEEVYCLVAKEKAILEYEDILEGNRKKQLEISRNEFVNNNTNNYVTNNNQVTEENTINKTAGTVIDEEFEKRITNNYKKHIVISAIVSFLAAFFGALIPVLVLLGKLK